MHTPLRRILMEVKEVRDHGARSGCLRDSRRETKKSAPKLKTITGRVQCLIDAEARDNISPDTKKTTRLDTKRCFTQSGEQHLHPDAVLQETQNYYYYPEAATLK